MISPRRLPLTAEAANSTEATGGVCWPMEKLSAMTIPKWMGSYPSSVTRGQREGDDEDQPGDPVQEHPEEDQHDVDDEHQHVAVVGELHHLRRDLLGDAFVREVPPEHRRRGDHEEHDARSLGRHEDD